MFRSMLTALALATASAAGPGLADTEVVVTRGSERGPVVSGPRDATMPCRGSTDRKVGLYFTVSDPDGIDYAAVRIGAVAVRPAVSDHAAAYLWIAPGTRADRAYRWRLEEEPPFHVRRTIPVAIEVVGDPIDVLVKVKDGRGNLVDVPFLLNAERVLCR